ncbi:MAG: magnesium chelatase ATPase subunit I [Candidatus Abyssobacteria bacterium SURF_17]|uniref:Mg-protoporphyrin IX chelatase n=1 Tax=Candidatus Abyssobacteria bacterium SURF_17 TaxID=2093361 RepID=A0A419ETR6_9BACT|nr:MAG: magnesium chelatase ATPase subunit I [Candidatus Abyssubacteria bacterium SURF_17]
MRSSKLNFPFTAIVGQEKMKLALVLNAINPKLSGVLIRGEKGTAKSTAVRSLAVLLPNLHVVKDCPFHCDPYDIHKMCFECREKVRQNVNLEAEERQTRVINLPVNATEDRVVGTLDLEHAIKRGEKRFEPGVLADANRGILYVDEVNLLDDHIVDVLLDSAAMGVNSIEREGVSYTHPAEFILVGTMNPEEGELRPQLLDRFGLCVNIEGISDAEQRVEVVKRWVAFEEDPDAFIKEWQTAEADLRTKIVHAREILPEVEISDEVLNKIAQISIEIGVDGHRADIIMMKTAKTVAALHQRPVVTFEDLEESADMALQHRVRRKPFEDIVLDRERIASVLRQNVSVTK